MANDDPHVLARAVWFVFVGWWATGIWLSVAWLLNVTIIGLPLGIKMINRTPLVVSLKTSDRIVDDPTESQADQHSLVLRGLWFVFVGWWLSGLWLSVAYLLTITIVGIPIAIIMYNKLPFVVSLYRY